MDVRSLVVNWCYWAVAHQPWFRYLEWRPFPLYLPTASHYIHNDCAATTIQMLWLAGAPEPFPGAYSGWGDTQSFLGLEVITQAELLPADFVVYGGGLPIFDQHMATVLEPGSDPLTMSHGWSGEPALVPVSRGCPPQAQGRITYVRYLPTTTPPPPPPPQEDNVGQRLVQDPKSKGWWLVEDDRKAGIPDPTDLVTLQLEGIPVATMTEEELSGLTTVAWGAL